MIEFLDGLRAIAAEYPWLMGIITIVLAAALFVALDDLRRSLKSHEYSDQKKLEARRFAAERREYDKQIRDSKRAHQWH